MTETRSGPAQRTDGLTRTQIEEFLFLEARLADEHDYDGWEGLWTDDAIYWVPAGDDQSDPLDHVSVIYDNRARINTRMRQLATGKHFAQTPPSTLRRTVSNVEILGSRPSLSGCLDTEVAANFVLLESRPRGVELWGGRTTYRLRQEGDRIRLAYKKVELVNRDQALATLSFLI